MAIDAVVAKKSLLISFELPAALGGQPPRVSGVWDVVTQFWHGWPFPAHAGRTTMSRSPHSFWQPHVLAFGPCTHAVCEPAASDPDQNTEASSHWRLDEYVRVTSLNPPSTYSKRSRRPGALRIM